MTRPLEAPRSTAANVPSAVMAMMAALHRRKAAATPESTGTCRPVVRVRSPPVSAKTASAT